MANETNEEQGSEEVHNRLRQDDDAPFWVATRAFWKGMIEDALKATGGRADKAAQALGISKSWFFKLMKKLKIDRKACREDS